MSHLTPLLVRRALRETNTELEGEARLLWRWSGGTRVKIETGQEPKSGTPHSKKRTPPCSSPTPSLHLCLSSPFVFGQLSQSEVVSDFWTGVDPVSSGKSLPGPAVLYPGSTTVPGTVPGYGMVAGGCLLFFVLRGPAGLDFSFLPLVKVHGHIAPLVLDNTPQLFRKPGRTKHCVDIT